MGYQLHRFRSAAEVARFEAGKAMYKASELFRAIVSRHGIACLENPINHGARAWQQASLAAPGPQSTQPCQIPQHEPAQMH